MYSGIENIDFVVCKLCNRRFRSINNAHLKTHGLTGREYRELYSDSNIRCAISSDDHKRTLKLKRVKAGVDVEGLYGKGMIEDINYVVCRICDSRFKMISTHGHLKIHGITYLEYKVKFPSAVTYCEKSLDKRRDTYHRKIVSKRIELGLDPDGIYSSSLVEEVDYVVCKICDERFEVLLTNGHLRVHEIAIDEYIKIFPVSETHSILYRDKVGESMLGNTNTLGHKYSQERKDGMKGRPAWNKGLTKKTDLRVAKISETRLGMEFSDSHKNNLKKSHLGKKQSSETIEKRMIQIRGKPNEKLKGSTPWNKGLTVETDERVASYTKLMTGSKRPNVSKSRADGIVNGTIKIGRSKVTYHKSYKMGHMIMCQSSYEVRACEIFDALEDIDAYIPHPIRIPYQWGDDSLHNYVPDFMVLMKDGSIVVIEIKPEYCVDDDINVLKFGAADDYCRNNDMTFEVWTEACLFNNGSPITFE